MSLKTPLNQNLDIKCPKCNHKFVYNLNLDDIKEVNSNKSVQNVKGYIFEYPENTVDSVELIKLK